MLLVKANFSLFSYSVFLVLEINLGKKNCLPTLLLKKRGIFKSRLRFTALCLVHYLQNTRNQVMLLTTSFHNLFAQL